ncbi:MAG: hypothetical protein QOE37_2215, partial [Microbacteriaceae bacterium]|nr:hypothetical protein [Microbacteriaceae bacterium]
PFPALVMPSLTPGGAGNSRLNPLDKSAASALIITRGRDSALRYNGGFLARRSSERLHPTNLIAESSMLIAAQPIVSTTHSRTTSQPEALASAVNVSLTPVQTTVPPGSNYSDSQLTDEQVDFVQSLWNANVAAADIARVIERMKNEVPDEDGTGAVGGSNLGGLPPSYDSLRRQ